MLQPVVSIVIPVYNAEAHVCESVESVLQQDLPHHLLELIVVDDGSTDSSVSIIQDLLSKCDFHADLIRTENGGPSRARNLGWQQAKGSWIQFADADDLLHPGKIGLQMQAAAELSSDVAVAYSDWQRLRLIDGDWVPDGETISPRIEGDALVALLQAHNFIATGSQLFRRSWLEEVGGFDERYRLIEDVDLMLRIAMAGGKFHRITADQPLFFYRQLSGGSLSQQNKDAFMDGCVRNAQLVENYCVTRGQMTPAQRQAILSVYFQVARYYADKDAANFEQAAQRLEQFHPGFLPVGPYHLRQLSRVLGYRRAERVAVQWRAWKRFVRKRSRQSDHQTVKGFVQ